MKLVVLGTSAGGPPRLHRQGSAWALVIGEDVLLFDCGPSATLQLVRAGIPLERVTRLFFTHHHFDHFIDYPYLAISSWLRGRRGPLKVYGPAPTARISEQLFGAGGVFDQDLRSRSQGEGAQRIHLSNHGRRLDHLTVDATDIVAPGVVCSGADWTVTAAFTRHTQPFMESVAYRVDQGDRSIVFSGDTGPSDSVRELARGASVLVHECTRPDENLRELHLESHHSGPAAVGRLATAAGVGRLVLVHFSSANDSDAAIAAMAETVRGIYPGEVIAANDLTEVEVGVGSRA